MFTIYKVTSPSSKVYIGITSESLSKRKEKHIQCALKGYRTGKFQNAIKKYKDQLIWEIIDKVDFIEDAKKKEIYYINQFDSYNKGYNCTLGGEGNWGWKPSAETRSKIATSHKGKKTSKEHRKSISKALKLYCRDTKNLDKMALERGAKPMLMLDLRGNVIERFVCKATIAKRYDLQRSNIRKCLNGLRRHTGGFIFKYEGIING